MHGAMTMQWFRSKGFSFVALFALSLQFALSFGHLHLDTGIIGAQHPSKILATHDATESIVALDAASGDLPEHNDDYCSICAVIHLARSLVLSPAPSLLLLPSYVRAEFTAENEASVAGLNRTSFQARAPPIA